MPELSRFNGISIKIHWEANERHHKPHIYVYYNEYEAVIGIDGELLSGKLPEKQFTLVKAWLYLHEDDLYEAWNKCLRNEPVAKIEPLK